MAADLFFFISTNYPLLLTTHHVSLSLESYPMLHCRLLSIIVILCSLSMVYQRNLFQIMVPVSVQGKSQSLLPNMAFNIPQYPHIMQSKMDSQRDTLELSKTFCKSSGIWTRTPLSNGLPSPMEIQNNCVYVDLLMKLHET